MTGTAIHRRVAHEDVVIAIRRRFPCEEGIAAAVEAAIHDEHGAVRIHDFERGRFRRAADLRHGEIEHEFLARLRGETIRVMLAGLGERAPDARGELSDLHRAIFEIRRRGRDRREIVGIEFQFG